MELKLDELGIVDILLESVYVRKATGNEKTTRLAPYYEVIIGIGPDAIAQVLVDPVGIEYLKKHLDEKTRAALVEKLGGK